MPGKRKSPPPKADASQGGDHAEVRIIGGAHRGRRLQYHGDPVVRPMKHRTREAIFNLISTECEGRHAIDLFAGTGALGLEAVSRGAASATFIEKHVPSARIVEQNIRTLGVEDCCQLVITSAFLWGKRDLSETTATEQNGRPWIVFCSPPYVFFQDRRAEMLDLIKRIQQHAPSGSVLIVEADDQFDIELLREAETSPGNSSWDIRAYAPAVVGLWRSAD